MGPFDRRAAIVTGAASGIGAATLRRLRRDGADVIGTDIDEAAGQRVAQEAGARFFAQDTSDPAGWDELMQLSQREFGRLDILVNNAGMTTGQSIDDVDLKTWERVIGVNLTGVMLGCRAAVRLMRDNPGGAPGAIVNVASTSAYAALPTDIGYTAAKSGVRMLTKSVAVHCAKQELSDPLQQYRARRDRHRHPLGGRRGYSGSEGRRRRHLAAEPPRPAGRDRRGHSLPCL